MEHLCASACQATSLQVPLNPVQHLGANGFAQVSSLDGSFFQTLEKVGCKTSSTIAEHCRDAASPPHPRIVRAERYAKLRPHTHKKENVKRISLPLGALTRGLKLGPLASSSRL